MSYLLPIYSAFFVVLALALVLFALSRSNEKNQRKYAKVRVLIDDNRKQRIPPPDDDINGDHRTEWLLVSGALLLLLIILRAAN